MSQADKQYLPVLMVNNTHGIAGCMKCSLLCDTPDALNCLHTVSFHADGSEPITIEKLGPKPPFMLLTLAGIDSPEKAAACKGQVLYGNRDDIAKEDDSFFIADMIGLPVYDATDGTHLGVLHDILDNPANQLYEIDTPNGTVLFPVIRKFIDHIDLQSGIFLRPIPGFFTGHAASDTTQQTAAKISKEEKHHAI